MRNLKGDGSEVSCSTIKTAGSRPIINDLPCSLAVHPTFEGGGMPPPSFRIDGKFSICSTNSIMAPTASSRTLRIRGIARETPVDQLQAAIESAGSTAGRRSRLNPFASSAASTPNQPTLSLANQNTFMTSTVSFTTADAKTKAIKKLAEDHASWEVDDQFAGLTILRAPDDTRIDIE